MPIGPIPPGCVAVCAPPAFDVSAGTNVTGVCSESTAGVTLSDVTVRGCSATGFDFLLLPDSPNSVAVVISVNVPYTFTGTIDGFCFQGSSTCTDTITVVVPLLASPERFAQPLDCASDLTCTATPVPFNNSTSTQSFIITVTGTTTCVACSGTFSVVAACLPTTR